MTIRFIGDDSPDRIERRRELSYRRGFHQGWAYATTIILDDLLSKGVDIKEIRRLVANYENRQIMPWRQDVSVLPYATPNFTTTTGPVSTEEEEGEDV